MTDAYLDLVRREPYIVTFLRLNEAAASTIAYDYGARNTLNGAYTNPSIAGPALIEDDDLAGSSTMGSGQLVSIPNTAVLQLTAALSLEAWIAPYSIQTAILVGKMNSAGTIAGPYALTLNGGRLQISVGNGTTAATFLGPSLPVGSSSHVVATLFRGNIALYVDGQRVAYTTIASQTVTDQGQALLVGSGMTGLIGEIAVYSGALSALRVARHFAVGRQLIPDAAHFLGVDPPVVTSS